MGTGIPASGASLERFEDRLREQLGRNAGTIVSGVVAGASAAVEGLAALFLTLTLLFFFVKDGERLSRAAISAFPRSVHDKVSGAASAVWQTLTGYVRGVAVIGVVNSVAIGLALLLLGVPLVGPLMLITFLGAFFPLIGAVVSGALAVLVALVAGGPIDALILAAVVLAVQQLEGDLVAPLVFSKAVDLHPVAVLLSITAGALLAGVVGAFLAVPFTASVAAGTKVLRNHPEEGTETEGGPRPRLVSHLRRDDGGSHP